ncbi:MAG: isocitrate/isopropylmalate dehydrogenase family protein [Desulfobacterales bacterium]|nr:MAG: isocitrate/isopropylmalate dehydrogenase family protein [Desulfobacterales bacterium]
MNRYRIAVLPGDGIGPEIMRTALSVLNSAVSAVGGLQLEFREYPLGANHYRRTGEVLPDAVVESCRAADAVLLSAMGLTDVRLPDGTEVQPQIIVGLRRALDLYAAIRPIKLYPGAPTPLKEVGRGIDFIVLRENTEGLFASFNGGSIVNNQVATDTLVVTRAGTERIVEFAFRLAQQRQGRPIDGRRTVTCVDKANVFRSYAFFRKIFYDVAARHSDITAEAIHVDAMSLYLVQNPSAYDVLVMENMFGDILSDLGAGLIGGLGLGPSGEIGDRHAMFQPSHGSAPQIAGMNIANPLAMILSTAMMLDWLGETKGDPKAGEVGKRIEAAAAQAIAEGATLTPDLGGVAGTKEVGEAVRRLIESGGHPIG